MNKSDEIETRILLLRHAETSAPDQFHGAESDVGLSEQGNAQAESVARLLAALRPTALYTSGMRRARETSAPIARATGLDPVILPLLHERRMAFMSGMSRDKGWPLYADVKSRWMAGDLDATHPGGESYRDIRERVLPVVDRLLAKHHRETIVIVAHGVLIRVVITSLVDGLGPADFDRTGIEFVAVNDLRWNGLRWRADGILRAEATA
jgi:broad specificity phosphatase PhoE